MRWPRSKRKVDPRRGGRYSDFMTRAMFLFVTVWYEVFKKTYSDLVGEEAAYKYKTGLYLAASASAEFFADIALCPFEAVKVRMQTTIPPFATGTVNGLSTITGKEGYGG